MVIELNRGIGEEKTGLASGLRRWAAVKAFGEVCPYCGATDITVEGGELVCRRCSSVIRRLFDCEVGYWPSNDGEEAVRVSAEDVRREREFQARHRDAKDWLIKVEEESRKSTANVDPDRADGSTKLVERLRGNTTAIQNNDPRNPLSTKAPLTNSMVEENYVRRLAEKLTSNGFFEDGEVKVFAQVLAELLEARLGKVDKLPSVDMVARVLDNVLHGVPNTGGNKIDMDIASAIRDAIERAGCHRDVVRYVIRSRFGLEPNEELIELGLNYLYMLDTWITDSGIGSRGIRDYIGEAAVAAAALAIAEVELGSPKYALNILNDKGAKTVITRLKLNEFIKQLEQR
jgi:transcription initiation factor TFIIIB Brf1 subunit/transcription initiation factor TFIIB